MAPYAKAWQDAVVHGNAAPAFRPDGFEQWSRLLAMGGGQEQTVERLIESAKSYAGFLQTMLAAATGAGAPSGGTPWGDAFARGFGPAGLGAGLFEHPVARAWRPMAAPAFAGLPDFASNAGSDELKAWLSLPAFGYLREHQEHYQKMAVATVEYQQQVARYSALMLKAQQRGFELFESRLAEREQPGRQIESLRALYDLWVDAAEEAYAEVALSGEFRDVYAALVNAQMRVRSQIQQEVERIGSDFGMPTRSELDSIGERLHALRREVRERSSDGSGALAGQVAALRAEFEAFRAAGARSPAAAAAGRARKRPAADKPARAARRAVPAAKPGGRRKSKPPRGAGRAVAASAAGNFSSRIERFAQDSLGSRRRGALTAAKPAAPGGGPTTRRKKR